MVSCVCVCVCVCRVYDVVKTALEVRERGQNAKLITPLNLVNCIPKAQETEVSVRHTHTHCSPVNGCMHATPSYLYPSLCAKVRRSSIGYPGWP